MLHVYLMKNRKLCLQLLSVNKTNNYLIITRNELNAFCKNDVMCINTEDSIWQTLMWTIIIHSWSSIQKMKGIISINSEIYRKEKGINALFRKKKYWRYFKKSSVNIAYKDPFSYKSNRVAIVRIPYNVLFWQM